LTVGLFGGLVRQVAFTPEGRYLATANENGTISLLRTPTPPGAYAPGSQTKLPDPAELAKRPSAADTLKREDIPAEWLAKAGGGGPTKAPPGLVAGLGGIPLRHDDWAVGAFFRADGETLLSVGRDNQARLWDLKTGRQRKMFQGPKTPHGVHAAALSSDGKVLAWGTGGSGKGDVWGDGIIKLLDATTGEELRTVRHGNCVLVVAFSPDGKTLATGSSHDNSCRLWEVASGKEVGVLAQGPHNVQGIAFRPDGKVLAVWYATGDARVFNVSKPDEPKPLPFREVSSLVYLPDGKTLAIAVGRTNGTVILWGRTPARNGPSSGT